MRARRTVAGLAGLVALAVGLTGCGGPPAADRAADGDGGPTGELMVFAAASLTEAFPRIGAEFEAVHPGVSVSFQFAGSSTLARQIDEGAPADVFAAANPDTMRTVIEAGNGAGEPVVFTRNQLVIAVPEDNPAGVTALADLAEPKIKVALCAAQVPCGAAAATALTAAGVALTPVTLESDVRATLSKVRLGEVDAALVYRTDAAAFDGVDAVEFPESAVAINDYPIVGLAEATNPTAAAAFVEYVRSAPAQRTLADAGFLPGGGDAGT